jgi:hypothetical protein
MIVSSGYILSPQRKPLKKRSIKNGFESISDFTATTLDMENEKENQKTGKSGGGIRLDPLRKTPTLTIQNNRS